MGIDIKSGSSMPPSTRRSLSSAGPVDPAEYEPATPQATGDGSYDEEGAAALAELEKEDTARSAAAEIADLKAKVLLAETARKTLTETLARERREHVELCAKYTESEEELAAAERQHTKDDQAVLLHRIENNRRRRRRRCCRSPRQGARSLPAANMSAAGRSRTTARAAGSWCLSLGRCPRRPPTGRRRGRAWEVSRSARPPAGPSREACAFASPRGREKLAAHVVCPRSRSGFAVTWPRACVHASRSLASRVSWSRLGLASLDVTSRARTQGVRRAHVGRTSAHG